MPDTQLMNAKPFPPQEETKSEHRRRILLKALRVFVGVSAAVTGVLMVLVVAAIGHCSAFGGTCPRPSTLDGDVFGGAAMGAALAIGVPMWMARPTRRRFLIALGAAVVAGLLVGALVMAATAG